MSSKELSKLEPLVDVLEPLNKAQGVFLCYRLLGMNERHALKEVSRSRDTLNTDWETEVEFCDIRDTVLSNHRRYEDEAKMVLSAALPRNFLIGLYILSEKASHWDDLTATDKRYVMDAMKMMKTDNPKKDDSYASKIKEFRE